MGQICGKIVLTGGPCAGKTSALSIIEKKLIEQGYHVFVLAESATEFIKGGIRAFGKCALENECFESLILRYQLAKEKLYEEAANSLAKDVKCVIIYDRGIMDNKAFLTAEQFSEITKKLNLNELDMMDYYDMVIHLVTAADGKEECYTLANNEARTETPEQARTLDKKTMNAWAGHSNLKIIDNSSDFDGKLDRVINEIANFLGNPVSLKTQRKYLLASNESFSFLDNIDYTEIQIKQFYLKTGNPYYEKRLRERIRGKQSTYYFTVQRKSPNGVSEVVLDKRISQHDYQRLLSSHEISGTISKTRSSFVYDNQYYRLDKFDDRDLVLLEVEPTLENREVKAPSFVQTAIDVTDDKTYQNASLALKSHGKMKERV